MGDLVDREAVLALMGQHFYEPPHSVLDAITALPSMLPAIELVVNPLVWSEVKYLGDETVFEADLYRIYRLGRPYWSASPYRGKEFGTPEAAKLAVEDYHQRRIRLSVTLLASAALERRKK